MQTFSQYIKELNFTRGIENLVVDAENAGFDIKKQYFKHSFQIAKMKNGIVECGVLVFQNGTALNLTAHLSEAKVIRTIREMREILGL
jgi:hypothetical protein